jgi:uncharacterized protein (TIGR02722 family)
MKTYFILPAIICTFALAGCGTPPPGTGAYIDPNGPHVINNVGKLNDQDFDTAGADLVQELLNSSVLQNAAHQPAILAISRITNETDQQFDTDRLTSNIRIALLNTGKIQTTTTEGPGGNVQDPMARDLQNRNAFLNDQPAPVRQVDYTLTGKIMVDKTQAGNTRQSIYTFYLTLTDIRTGTGVWEGSKKIAKQGTTSSIGF